MRKDPETQLAIIDTRIAWVLDHPDMSDWLKQALRMAERYDPTMIQNDIEIIQALLLPRATIQVQLAKGTRSTSPSIPQSE